MLLAQLVFGVLWCSILCSFSTGDRGGVRDWELIFRAKAGNGQRVTPAWFGVGYDLCTSREGCFPKDGCFQDSIDLMALAVEHREVVRHLRSRIIDNWTLENIRKVKLALYTQGREVAYVIFNAKDTNNENWFSNTRMIESSWCDMKRSGPFNYFSIRGQGERSFHINKEYGGCPKDFGWLTVSEGKVFCEWDKHSSYPQFLYGRNARSTHWGLKEFGKAEVFAVFIQRD